MDRSPLSVLSSFSVPIHLNILGWGVAAAAAYFFAPEALSAPLVGYGVALFGLLYTVVAMILLVVRVGAAEQARHVPQMSWSAVAMALVGAALLLVVAFQVGGTAGRAMVLAAPVIGLLCGIVGVVSLRRSSAT